MLDQLGLDYIEGGYPGSNPTDTELFSSKPKLETSRFTAFGMTKRAGRSVSNDPGFQALVQSQRTASASWRRRGTIIVRVALGITNEENLEGIADSIKAVVASGKEAMLDCEHFFDGFKGNKTYALSVAKTAYDAGARWVCAL